MFIFLNMDTDDITGVLIGAERTRPAFIGTFAANRLPRFILRRPSILIVNSQADCFPGSHWTCFYLPKYQLGVEYFDSLGAAPTIPYFLRFINRNGGLIRHCNRVIQANDSDVCGEYCCVFAMERVLGVSLHHFISQFSSNTIANDRLIMEKFNSYFSCRAHFYRPTLRSFHRQTCLPFCHRSTRQCIAHNDWPTSRGGRRHCRRSRQQRNLSQPPTPLRSRR